MPQRFTRSFAERLHRISGAEVKEAEHLDRILPGRVLIAPGGRHLVVRREGLQYYVETLDGPLRGAAPAQRAAAAAAGCGPDLRGRQRQRSAGPAGAAEAAAQPDGGGPGDAGHGWHRADPAIAAEGHRRSPHRRLQS
eukprot:XP_015584332.1 uncharacterized protein LOC107262646 [Ricinus communis]